MLTSQTPDWPLRAATLRRSTLASPMHAGIAAFAAVLCAEALILRGHLLNVLTAEPSVILFDAVALIFPAWIVGLGAYLFIDFRREAHAGVRTGEPAAFHYIPSELAYEAMLEALIAIAASNERYRDFRLGWVESLDLQWTKFYQGRSPLKKAALQRRLEIVRADPNIALQSLQTRQKDLKNQDKDVLIRLGYLLSNQAGRMTEIEADLMIRIAGAIGLPYPKLLAQ